MRLAGTSPTVEPAGVGIVRPVDSGGPRRLPTRLALSAGKLLLSGGLVGYLLYHHGFSHERLASIDPTLGAAAVAIFVLQLALATFRWRILLTHISGARPAFPRLFGVYYASAFFSQVLPSIGGDLARISYARILGTTAGPIVVSVLLDRGVAITALLLVALASLGLLAPFDPGHTVVRSIAVVAGGGLAAAYGGCLMARAMRYSQIWPRVPQSIRTFIASCDWSLTSRVGFCCLMPLYAFGHLLSIVALFLAAHAVQVPLAPSTVLAIGPVIVLAQVLPVSVGGWGVREAAAVTLLAMTGIDATSALLVSITFGILIFLATSPGVLFWVMLRE
jgi:hypothetical protein